MIPRLSKAERLQAVHESVEFALSALKSLSNTGFLVGTAEKMHLICCPVLPSYVADIPEIEDMLFVKMESRLTVHAQDVLF